VTTAETNGDCLGSIILVHADGALEEIGPIWGLHLCRLGVYVELVAQVEGVSNTTEERNHLVIKEVEMRVF